jgi:hypothetical protein
MSTDIIIPTAAPLPPLPAADPLTAAQWKTLLAIADAVIPSIQPFSKARPSVELAVPDAAYVTALSTLRGLAPQGTDEKVLEAYLKESASSDPAFRESFRRIVAEYMPQSSRGEFGMILNILK